MDHTFETELTPSGITKNLTGQQNEIPFRARALFEGMHIAQYTDADPFFLHPVSGWALN